LAKLLTRKITGSNPVLATNRGIGVPLEAKYKPWSLNVNQPLNQLYSQVAFWKAQHLPGLRLTANGTLHDKAEAGSIPVLTTKKYLNSLSEVRNRMLLSL